MDVTNLSVNLLASTVLRTGGCKEAPWCKWKLSNLWLYLSRISDQWQMGLGTHVDGTDFGVVGKIPGAKQSIDAKSV